LLQLIDYQVVAEFKSSRHFCGSRLARRSAGLAIGYPLNELIVPVSLSPNQVSAIGSGASLQARFSQADAGDKKFKSHLAAPTFQSPSLQRATTGFLSILRCRLL
jgi:hypothetical protein